MKKIISLLSIILIIFIGCKDETDCCVNVRPLKVTLNFTHHWNGVPITNADFNTFKFITENNHTISIDQLRYVISNIHIGTAVKEYQLINVEENTGLVFDIVEVNQGENFLKFRFGFSDDDNKDGEYEDLNSVSFNVPGMMGGGYHYMQFDGKYKDINEANANFNYHAIRAFYKTEANDFVFQDTSFEVDLGLIEFTKDTTIEIKHNVAEWFKNPNQWNLNVLNTGLMMNFEAQKAMSANGKSVFTLGE